MTTTLSGHATHIKGLLNLADHTYVTSSDGKVWPCWGGSAGGSVICSGPGNSAAADCNSFPLKLAGIIYAVTGVCHQTSNRILLPSLQNVIAARAAPVSYAAYGVLGMDMPGNPPGYCPIFLAKAAACALANIGKDATLKAQPKAVSAASVGPDKKDQASFMQELIDLQEGAIYSLHMAVKGKAETTKEAVTPSNISAGELKLMVKYRLRDDYDKSKVGQIVDVRTAMSRKTMECHEDIIAAKSSPDSIAQKINDEIGKMQVDMKDVLGEKDYESFLGHSETDIMIVDPEILANSMENKSQR